MIRRQFLPLAATAALPGQTKRPNIPLILADDLGFSDPGCFPGEISTPNLDRPGAGGIRFTQLHNNGRCCRSRTALMTGQHPHRAGIGNRTGAPRLAGFPGYSGRVNADAPFLPAVLKQSGYSTMMCGMWHLGQPSALPRGFDEFFGMIQGFDSFWEPSKHTRLPAGRPGKQHAPFHATEAITGHALDFIDTALAQAKPWFLYLAYNAPHFLLHAPRELIDKYQPDHEQGWDVLREQRFARRTKRPGKGARLTPRRVARPNRVSTPNGRASRQNPPWDSLDADRRTDLARRMAIFAAMVEQMNTGIGGILNDLKARQEFQNTLLLFYSDNGACAEWTPFGFDVSSGPIHVLHAGEKLDEMGRPGTCHSYGSAWANLSDTPWRLYKHYTHEGGISRPCIPHWPAHTKPGVDHRPWHCIDLLPTLAHVAGATSPPGIAGENMAAAFTGSRAARGPLVWVHEGSREVRDGKWKLTAVSPNGAWEHYDIDADRSELNNLAAAHTDRGKAMSARWEQWARQNQVIPWIWDPQYGETSK